MIHPDALTYLSPRVLVTVSVMMQGKKVSKPQVQGQVHEGFHEVLFSCGQSEASATGLIIPRICMFRDICEILHKYTTSGMPVYITGHGLGEMSGCLINQLGPIRKRLEREKCPILFHVKLPNAVGDKQAIAMQFCKQIILGQLNCSIPNCCHLL